ncbi:hypothetical protein FQN57_003325 [Myotisia sp. PD_48]|nr:hypothetical protein FQN57_003325 [Myotisia sp. PD_48]
MSPDTAGPTTSPPELPEGWLAQWHGQSQKWYYVQPVTGISVWEVPTEPFITSTSNTPYSAASPGPFSVPLPGISSSTEAEEWKDLQSSKLRPSGTFTSLPPQSSSPGGEVSHYSHSSQTVGRPGSVETMSQGSDHRGSKNPTPQQSGYVPTTTSSPGGQRQFSPQQSHNRNSGQGPYTVGQRGMEPSMSTASSGKYYDTEMYESSGSRSGSYGGQPQGDPTYTNPSGSNVPNPYGGQSSSAYRTDDHGIIHLNQGGNTSSVFPIPHREAQRKRQGQQPQSSANYQTVPGQPYPPRGPPENYNPRYHRDAGYQQRSPPQHQSGYGPNPTYDPRMEHGRPPYQDYNQPPPASFGARRQPSDGHVPQWQHEPPYQAGPPNPAYQPPSQFYGDTHQGNGGWR